MNISAIVLAAGKGTRMESQKPKVLHEIGGKPMISHTLEKLSHLNLKQIIVVVGYKAEEVQNVLGPEWTYAFQENPTGGTADAVKAGLSKISPDSEVILVIYGDDSAFYKLETLKDFLASHMESGNVVSVITADQPQTERVGRIIRDKNEKFKLSIEVWEYEKSGLYSDEVNCCVYLFDKKWLKDHINKIKNDNDRDEYRITDILNIAHAEETEVGLFKLKDPNEWVGINTMEDLEKARRLMEDR